MIESYSKEKSGAIRSLSFQKIKEVSKKVLTFIKRFVTIITVRDSKERN
jgi:hypothetical protein